MRYHQPYAHDAHCSTRGFIFANAMAQDRIVELAPGQSWGFKGRRRLQTLICQQGSVWVTQEGDIHDHVLREGDAFVVTMPGLVLVRAFAPARVGYCDGFSAVPFRGRFTQTVFK